MTRVTFMPSPSRPSCRPSGGRRRRLRPLPRHAVLQLHPQPHLARRRQRQMSMIVHSRARPSAPAVVLERAVVAAADARARAGHNQHALPGLPASLLPRPSLILDGLTCGMSLASGCTRSKTPPPKPVEPCGKRCAARWRRLLTRATGRYKRRAGSFSFWRHACYSTAVVASTASRRKRYPGGCSCLRTAAGANCWRRLQQQPTPTRFNRGRHLTHAHPRTKECVEAQLGELSAASSALTAAPLAPLTTDTLDALRDPLKRPQERQVPLPNWLADYVPEEGPSTLDAARFCTL